MVVEATVKCLDIIKPGLGLSTVLPVNMAARFRLGATLAQACAVRFHEYENYLRNFNILILLIPNL